MSTDNENISAGSNHENAPLLSNPTSGNIETDSAEAANEGAWKQPKADSCFYQVRQWAFNHWTMIAISLLLLGGIVALCVYFAGMIHVIAV